MCLVGPPARCVHATKTKRGRFDPAAPTRKLPLIETPLNPSRFVWIEGGHQIRPWALPRQFPNGAAGRRAPIVEQVHQVAATAEARTFPRCRTVERIAHVRGEDAEPVVGTDGIVLEIVGIGRCYPV